ncbi:M56 family metallopeptidase [Pedobacter sp.]|uniref:M56 family metallopeptidase n=1 Tax=Pedobacter sp. TaxID=1411316 RepID=UPI003BAA7E59
MEFKWIGFLPENWLNALGNTLFHSLWLGILLALISGLVMFLTRKSAAVFRYNLLVVCLLLFVFATAFVFYKQMQWPGKAKVYSSVIVDRQFTKASGTTQDILTQSEINLKDVLERIFSFWQHYSGQIVFIWFLIICFKSLQLLAGLRGIYQLRYFDTYDAGKHWEEKLNKLAMQLEVFQKVRILQSGLATMPMVLGHFKPLVLVPLGLLNGLSGREVEAILAHELAHVKRRDYLVNILQSFIEIIFFFNPAVMWVSHLIKTEREHCCDDLAVACVQDRKDYVKALVFCQEFKLSAPAYVMAINGKKGNLLSRASRMLFNTNSTLNKMEKTILSLALVSVVVCTAAFKNDRKAVARVHSPITTYEHVVQDTTRKAKAVKKAKQAAVKNSDEEIKSEHLEKEIAKKVAQAEEEQLENSKKLEKQIKTKVDDQGLQEAHRKKYLEAQKQYLADQKQYAADQKKYAEDQRRYVIDVLQQEQERQKIKAPKAPKAPKTPPAPPLAPAPRLKHAPKSVPPKAPAAPPTPPKYGTPAPPPAPPLPPKNNANINIKAGTDVNVNASTDLTIKTGVERKVTAKTVTNGDGKDYTDEINQELLKDGLVSSLQNLSYKLNKNELIVNNQKVENSLHQKYKTRFLKSNGHSLMYNYVISSR